MAKLHHSLIEMCLVVGMDADTGLKPAHEQPSCGIRGESNPLYCRAYDAHVLAAVSGQLATFPQCGEIQNLEAQALADSYPIGSRNINKQTLLKKAKTRRPSRRMSLVPQLSIATTSGGQQALTLPISNEIITSMVPLCLPDGGYVYRSQLDACLHSLVLTDIKGNRSYALCLTYYRSFIATRESDDSYELALDTGSPTVTDTQRCYIPTCVVLMSKYPYYSVIKDCLSSLLPKLMDDPIYFNFHIKEFTQQMAMVPIPPPGTLNISFRINQLPVIMRAPQDPDKGICDIFLHYPFLCFEAAEIIEIITCILTQQRIVFLSCDYNLLTPVMECFMMFIQPMKWQHTYVPVLPYQLLDLLESPGVFVMGCHSKYKDRVAEIPGLVIANLDTGTVDKCSSLQVPPMPEVPAEDFGSGYFKAKKHFDMLLLGRPSPASLDALSQMKYQFMVQCQTDIQTLFLELIVTLFGEVSEFLHIAQHHFKREEFLEAQCMEDREFYTQVIKTDLFKQFLRDRLNQKRDYYAIMEERMRPVLKDTKGVIIEPQKLLGRKSSASSIVVTRTRKSSFNLGDSIVGRQPQPNQLQTDTHVTFTLPAFQKPFIAGTFWERCIRDLNSCIENVKSPNLRASYLYLRGMFYVASAQPINGIKDFHDLAAADLRIFPTDIVGQVLGNLSAQDKERLGQQSFYKRAEVWKKISERKENGSRVKVTMELEKVPTKPVDLKEFIKHIQLLEIAIDIDAINRLFTSLTLGRTQVVEPDTFAIFYECWKESEIETSSLALPPDELDHNECVLKVSSLIRTDHGTGRLILTQKRLFFLSEGKRKLKEVIRLRDIQNIEKYEYTRHIFPPGVPALKIFHKKEGKAPYIASLKSERNSWYILIKEMWAGRIIADVQKDYQVIQQAAQNVLMIDAIIRSGDSEESTHSSAVEAAADNLCYFTRRREEGMANLPEETTSALIHRVNPSNRNEQKATVEALLYTPGNRSKGDEDNSPKLWCALGTGKIRVFDASTWICESQFIEAKDRVCCLMSVKGDQVWAGSFDTTIYIIDIDKYTANKRLIDHADFVSDLTKNSDESVAYSASLNGQIISWNTSTLQKIKCIDLEDVDTLICIKWITGNLWCCNKRDLRVLDSDGGVLRKLQIPDGSGFPAQIECFFVTPNNQLWTGCARKGQLVSWNAETFERLGTLEVKCRGFSKLVYAQEKIWAGSKSGKIHIFNTVTCSHEKELVAHEAAIRSMCTAEDRYVMTGAEGIDGKIAIWRAKFLTQV
ncbi:DENN domain-containing protein 3-like [Glandiceps talaboti]